MGQEGRYDTILNEIICMMYAKFDDLPPESVRESSKRKQGGLFLMRLRSSIDKRNEWVCNTANSGVYKTGLRNELHHRG